VKIPFGKLAAITAIGAAAISPAVAAAHPGHGNGKGQQHAQSHGKAKPHAVTYVFKGTWNAAAGTVTVKGGNSHVRKAGFVGQDVQFDLTGAKVVVRDTNGDGHRNASDLMDGDRVVVTARLPRSGAGAPPFKARMIVDQTHPRHAAAH
jgi:hypothetical protein